MLAGTMRRRGLQGCSVACREAASLIGHAFWEIGRFYRTDVHTTAVVRDFLPGGRKIPLPISRRLQIEASGMRPSVSPVGGTLGGVSFP